MPRWLSLGCRVTLVISVLQAIPVYWFSLFIVPVYVIQHLHKIMFQFLWSRVLNCKKFHLANWSSISHPKQWGGWGIKHLKVFNIALVAKIMWWALNDSGLWGILLKSKYMYRLPLELWLRRNNSPHSNSSLLWRSFILSITHMNLNLCWNVGRGNCIYVGIDPLVGIDRPFLSDRMLDWLHENHLVTLQYIYISFNWHKACWLSLDNLGLPLTLAPEWNSYVATLYNAWCIILNSN